MYWFILYVMHKNAMIYEHYHLSPEFDSVKFKHKTTNSSSSVLLSAPGEAYGLLQLISTRHEQHHDMYYMRFIDNSSCTLLIHMISHMHIYMQ